HGGRDLALARALQQALEIGERRGGERRRLSPPLWQVPPERGPALVQVLLLRAAVGERQERQRGNRFVANRDAETVAELLQRFLRHLLRLVADHLAFAGFAHAVAL